MNDRVKWQRETAMRKIDVLRRELEKDGAPFTDERLARAAAGYVGVDFKQVMRWMSEANNG